MANTIMSNVMANAKTHFDVILKECYPLVSSLLMIIKNNAFGEEDNLFVSIMNTCSKYDILTVSFIVCLVFIYYCFTWSIIGNNCSKVDQIWSITPIVYAWLFYCLDGTKNIRVLTMAILITLWGCRLTFNFWRRGGYGNLIVHEEDYRWPILREQINSPILFYIFNLTFIASYQNLLLWFICLPIYEVSKQSPKSLTTGDVVVSILFVTLLVFETLSDQQQWNFQNKKYSYTQEQRAQHSDDDIRNGFLTKGLFTYTRHPNYFCEQSIWVVVYLFSITGTDSISISSYINWSIFGVIQLIALFAGSMSFSEGITAKKYPAYKVYQKKVSQCIPIPFFFISDSNSDGDSDSNKKKNK